MGGTHHLLPSLTRKQQLNEPQARRPQQVKHTKSPPRRVYGGLASLPLPPPNGAVNLASFFQMLLPPSFTHYTLPQPSLQPSPKPVSGGSPDSSVSHTRDQEQSSNGDFITMHHTPSPLAFPPPHFSLTPPLPSTRVKTPFSPPHICQFPSVLKSHLRIHLHHIFYIQL